MAKKKRKRGRPRERCSVCTETETPTGLPMRLNKENGACQNCMQFAYRMAAKKLEGGEEAIESYRWKYVVLPELRMVELYDEGIVDDIADRRLERMEQAAARFRRLA